MPARNRAVSSAVATAWLWAEVAVNASSPASRTARLTALNTMAAGAVLPAYAIETPPLPKNSLPGPILRPICAFATIIAAAAVTP